MAKGKILADLSIRVSASTAELTKNLKEAKTNLGAFETSVKATGKSIGDSLASGSDKGQKSLKELRTEMKALSQVSFAGKTKEEIKAINTALGNLREDMKDLRAEQTNLAISAGELGTKLVQGLSGLAEVGIAVASTFGVSEDAIKKYTQAQTILIGAVQGLGAFQQMLGDRTLQVTALRIKDTVATVAQTAANWALEASFLAIIGTVGIILAIFAAAVAGTYALVKANEDQIDSADAVLARYKKVHEEMKLNEEQLANNIKMMKAEGKTEKEINDQLLADANARESIARGAVMANEDKIKKLKEETAALKERNKTMSSVTATPVGPVANQEYADNTLKIINNEKIILGLEKQLEGWPKTDEQEAYVGLKQEAAKASFDLLILEKEINTEQRKANEEAAKRYRGYVGISNRISDIETSMKDIVASGGVISPEMLAKLNKYKDKLAEVNAEINKQMGLNPGFEEREQARVDAWLRADAEIRAEQEASNKAQVESDAAASNEIMDRIKKGMIEQLAITRQFNTDYDKAQKDFNDRHKSQYQLDLEAYKAMLDKKLISLEQYNALVAEAEAKAAETSKGVNRKKWEDAAFAATSMITGISDVFKAAMEDELNQTGKTEKEKDAIRKKYGKKIKATAIAQAIINGAVGITKAIADLGPIAGAIAAIGVGLSTAAQVAMISSQPLAKGGIAYGETLATVGEYPGARSNPEVIAPLDKLKTLIGSDTTGFNGGEVRFVIEQDKLVGILGNANNQNIYF